MPSVESKEHFHNVANRDAKRNDLLNVAFSSGVRGRYLVLLR